VSFVWSDEKKNLSPPFYFQLPSAFDVRSSYAEWLSQGHSLIGVPESAALAAQNLYLSDFKLN
jgi:hypothetical protein